MNIEELRDEINAIDEAIVNLLDRRAKIVGGILQGGVVGKFFG